MIINGLPLPSLEIETITFLQFDENGNPGNTETVEAFFVGWLQQEKRMEVNYLLTYQCWCIDDTWSDWELSQRQQTPYTLRQLYDNLQKEYNNNKNAGMIMPLSRLNILKMYYVPIGQSSPIWWNDGDKSFYVFYKIYVLK